MRPPPAHESDRPSPLWSTETEGHTVNRKKAARLRLKARDLVGHRAFIHSSAVKLPKLPNLTVHAMNCLIAGFTSKFFAFRPGP